MLMYFSAIEPEDAAQSIMLKAYMAGGFDYPDYYWLTAARHEAIEQGRRRAVRNRYHAPLTDIMERTVSTREFIVGQPDRLEGLPITDEERTWLLEYYARRNHTGRQTVTAYRLRQYAQGAPRPARKWKRYELPELGPDPLMPVRVRARDADVSVLSDSERAWLEEYGDGKGRRGDRYKAWYLRRKALRLKEANDGIHAG